MNTKDKLGLFEFHPEQWCTAKWPVDSKKKVVTGWLVASETKKWPFFCLRRDQPSFYKKRQARKVV
jgi:hypothetical protein